MYDWRERVAVVVLVLGMVLLCQAAGPLAPKQAAEDLSAADLEALMQRTKELRKALDAMPQPAAKPNAGDLSPAEIRKLLQQTKELRVVVEGLREVHAALPQAPLPDDGGERVFLPARVVERPPLKCDLHLWRAQGCVMTLPSSAASNIITFVNSELEVRQTSSYPGFLTSALDVSAKRGFFAVKHDIRMFQSPPVVLTMGDGEQLEEAFTFDASVMVGEQHVARKGWAPFIHGFFEWGDGYGLLTRDIDLRPKRGTKPSRAVSNDLAWVVKLDSSFRPINAIEVKGGGFGAFAVGPGRTIVAIAQPDSMAFLYPNGDCHVLPVTSAKSWSKRMYGSPGLGGMNSARGIVPGSELFAVPYTDRGTLPVFDMTTRPPKLLHTLDVTGTSRDHVVSLVSGRRVYVKRDRKNAIEAWDFSDGVKLLWRRVFPGSDNKGQAYLGYHKGNIIAPGLAKITFIDEDTGLVNYEFLTPDAAGQPARPDDGKPLLSRAAPYILSYAILDNYLIGSSRDRGKPLYAWKIPEKLIPRKPLAVPAGDGK